VRQHSRGSRGKRGWARGRTGRFLAQESVRFLSPLPCESWLPLPAAPEGRRRQQPRRCPAVGIREAALAPKHLMLIKPLSNLDACYGKTGRCADAEMHFKRAVEIAEALGPERLYLMSAAYVAYRRRASAYRRPRLSSRAAARDLLVGRRVRTADSSPALRDRNDSGTGGPRSVPYICSAQ